MVQDADSSDNLSVFLDLLEIFYVAGIADNEGGLGLLSAGSDT